jgi:hypothetical protein
MRGLGGSWGASVCRIGGLSGFAAVNDIDLQATHRIRSGFDTDGMKKREAHHEMWMPDILWRSDALAGITLVLATQLSSVCGVQPILDATDATAAN